MTNPNSWPANEKIAVITNLTSMVIHIDASPAMMNYFREIKKQINLPSELNNQVEMHLSVGRGIGVNPIIRSMSKEKKDQVATWLRTLLTVDPYKKIDAMQTILFDMNYKALEL